MLCSALLVFGAQDCVRSAGPGFLEISAPAEGTYEVYRIASESPLQLVSEQVGNFNQKVPLSPGNYLVMADCSWESVVIFPEVVKKLDAFEVSFVPPQKPDSNDLFSVQCSRFDKIGSRQNTLDRYSLKILGGKREILVGMVPLKIDLTAPEAQASKRLSFPLAALRVHTNDAQQPLIPYFVSPVEGTLSITQSQKFGSWQFLLPGKYRLELNGTMLDVSLSQGDARTIVPASFRVSTSPSVKLELSPQITGSPIFLEINSDHWLALNETYEVLPGKAEIRVSGSTHKQELQFEEGQSYKLEPRSVMVDLGCKQGDRPCLGSREVFLYRGEEPYPFAKGVSNVPMLFFDEQVLIGLEGARDIRYELPHRDRDLTLKVGKVEVSINAEYHPGQVTDLIRVGTLGQPFFGHSVDFPMERKVSMFLFPGHYHLEHFVTIQTTEGDRKKTTTPFFVEAFQSKLLNVTIFLNEKKLALFQSDAKR